MAHEPVDRTHGADEETDARRRHKEKRGQEMLESENDIW